MRVICVKWGTKYGWEWVLRLEKMVANNLLMPHEFVCMTDDLDGAPMGMPLVPCEPNLPTWWSKVGLFVPGKFPGLNLYLDLDVVITGNLDQMVLENVNPGCLTAPDDFSYSLLNPKQGLGEHMQRLLGGPGTVNSSVMIWEGDDASDVYTQFHPDKMEEVHGDQNWISQCLWPDKLRLLKPGWACSYKYHVQRGEGILPITVFHGNPKVTELPRQHPLRQAWTA